MAPVFVKNHANFNLNRLWARFVEYDLGNRLGWALENTAAAINSVAPAFTGREQTNFRKEESDLHDFLARKKPPRTLGGSITINLDVLDGKALSNKTVSNLWKNAAPVSRRWLIVTALQVEDFIKALVSRVTVGKPAAITIGRPRKKSHDAN